MNERMNCNGICLVFVQKNNAASVLWPCFYADYLYYYYYQIII